MNDNVKAASSLSALKSRRGERALALVIVLFSLILLSGIVVAFFATVTSDRKSSAMYQDQGAAKRLADTAINMAIAQIRTASSGSTAWASQPGVIRCYNSSGKFVAGYKLYTSGTMVESSSEANLATGDLPPSDWASKPSLYTDLNSPVLVVSSAASATGTTAVFPIIDGNGLKNFSLLGRSFLSYSSGTSSAPDIQGFEVSGSTVSTYDPNLVLSGTYNPIPMPVMWHYILQDGRIVVPTDSGSVQGATKTNPIVGRIAFWTDDECAKVNINTASYDNPAPAVNGAGADKFSTYHAYHAAPLLEGTAERNLASYQPMRGEVQRFPGHPATTNLGSIFPQLSRDDIFKIVPRVVSGGSLGGTAITGTIAYDSDRLYATVGEILYSGTSATATSGTRFYNPYPSTSGTTLNEAMVEKARFFLTSRSRAPELNLFGKPRVAIWPIPLNSGSNYRTAFDELIRFCSTLGTSKFYMQRNVSTTGTDDQQIASNLALFGNASNTSYLQDLTGKDIPGFGGNFFSKYSADRDQILTEIEDYIRCANLSDPLLPAVGQFTPANPAGTFDLYSVAGHGQVTPLYNATNDTMGFGRFTTLSRVALHFICTADAGVPSSNSTTSNTSLGGVALTGTATTPGKSQRRIQAMLEFEGFNPSYGPGATTPNMSFTVSGLDTLQVKDPYGTSISLGFPSNPTPLALTGKPSSSGTQGNLYGGRVNTNFILTDRRLPACGPMPADAGINSSNSYSFVGVPVTVTCPVPAASPLMQLSQAQITISIYSGVGSNAQLVQTIPVVFPTAQMPVPSLVTGTFVSSDMAFPPQSFWAFRRGGVGAVSGTGRLRNLYSSGNAPLAIFNTPKTQVPYSDTLKGLSVAHGDYRLAAATRSPAATLFGVCPDYSNSNVPFGNEFLETGAVNGGNHDMPVPSNYQFGTLLTTGSYDTSWPGNSVPSGPSTAGYALLTGSVNRPWTYGDWDNGLSDRGDGPYINKPDEGVASSSSDPPYFQSNANFNMAISGSFASPNRIMPSAGMFGSLSTGVKGNRPWQTLLFRPYYKASSSGSPTHPGQANQDGSNASLQGAPPDHLLMDLFWMPVVEPYAISEMFSTQGKINMNYQILPFTYIRRDSGLRAVFSSERVIAIPSGSGTSYKSSTTTPPCRYPIDSDSTLAQFELKFQRNEIFKSATELCSLDLIPKVSQFSPSSITTTGSNMSSFWLANGLTGDNAKERPYANIYPRLTTKSNTYKIHYRVQSLKKSAATPAGVFMDPNSTAPGAKDVVLSELRGNAIIERYLDPTDTFPDYTDPTKFSAPNLDTFYKYRVVAGSEFLP